MYCSKLQTLRSGLYNGKYTYYSDNLVSFICRHELQDRIVSASRRGFCRLCNGLTPEGLPLHRNIQVILVIALTSGLLQFTDGKSTTSGFYLMLKVVNLAQRGKKLKDALSNVLQDVK